MYLQVSQKHEPALRSIDKALTSASSIEHKAAWTHDLLQLIVIVIQGTACDTYLPLPTWQ